ncbi:MAG TPA: PcfB family protein [Clostridiales bacterium]|nr:PcfB family protein [Clostridiales bacterium]
MQEEVEHRTVTLAISTTKLTGRVLKAAIRKLLASWKGRDSPKIPHGKQTVKQLIGQNAGVSNIEVTDSNIKSFERVARKYGVDFAVKKDASVRPPKFLVFFKARDADALTAAFQEFTAKTVRKTERPSVLAQLRKFKELLKNSVIDKVKRREQEQTR